MSVRVMLIGDHQLTQVGVGRVFRHAPNVQLLGSAGRTPDVARTVAQAAPDVVVLDMPSRSEAAVLDVCEQLSADGVAVVVFCETETERVAGAAVAAGAVAVVGKSEELSELLRATDAAAFAARSGARGHSAHISPALRRPAAAGPAATTLSPRQRELLQLLAAGAGTEAAAERLGVSQETVKTHMKGAMTKLGVSSRAEAVAVALRRGLIT